MDTFGAMNDHESTSEATPNPSLATDPPPYESPFERAARIAAGPSERREDRQWFADSGGRKSTRRPEDLDLDPRWLAALEDHLGSAESIIVRVRRGAGGYVDLFSQSVVFLDSEQGREAAKRIGIDIWGACVRHVSRHGPVLDFQLVILGRPSKGKATDLACESIRISLAEHASDDDQDTDPSALRSLVSHTSGMLREARADKAEHRQERAAMVAVIMSLLQALPAALDNVGSMIERASRLHDAGAKKLMDLIEYEIERERRAFAAEFDVAKIDAISKGITTASEIISGEAGAAFLQWLATRGGDPDAAPSTVQGAADRLAGSITVRQAATLGDDARDLVAALEAAADAPDEITALPSLVAALQVAAKHPEIAKDLTPNQRSLVAFLRGRVSASSAD